MHGHAANCRLPSASDGGITNFYAMNWTGLLPAAQVLGSVQPAHTGYFLAAALPHHNVGKLKVNQKALLRFSAYPYEEFGSV